MYITYSFIILLNFICNFIFVGSWSFVIFFVFLNIFPFTSSYFIFYRSFSFRHHKFHCRLVRQDEHFRNALLICKLVERRSHHILMVCESTVTRKANFIFYFLVLLRHTTITFFITRCTTGFLESCICL